MASARLDGELDRASCGRLDEHLGECAACREVLADFQRLSARLRVLEPFPECGDLKAKVARRLGERTRTEVTSSLWLDVRPVAGVAAALAFACGAWLASAGGREVGVAASARGSGRGDLTASIAASPQGWPVPQSDVAIESELLALFTGDGNSVTEGR